jgi:hypothetical protein
LTTSKTWSGLRLLAFPACAQGKIKAKAKIRMECLLIVERNGFLQGGGFKGGHPKISNPRWQWDFLLIWRRFNRPGGIGEAIQWIWI